MAKAEHSELKGLGIVVTGASSGIGQATAIRSALLGAKVVVHYRNNRDGAEATLAAISEFGGDAVAIKADICDSSDRSRLLDSAFDRLTHIDCWINNAGADVLTGDAAAFSFNEKMDILWQVDVNATTCLTRELFEKIKNQEVRAVIPSIVFVGWDQASYGMEGDAGQMFGATKAAVMALSKSFAQEFAPHARVNCIAPGWIKTAWGDQTTDSWSRRATASSLLQRWGTVDDIAGVATFLCSPASRFVNGQVIEVNGGWNRKP